MSEGQGTGRRVKLHVGRGRRFMRRSRARPSPTARLFRSAAWLHCRCDLASFPRDATHVCTARALHLRRGTAQASDTRAHTTARSICNARNSRPARLSQLGRVKTVRRAPRTGRCPCSRPLTGRQQRWTAPQLETIFSRVRLCVVSLEPQVWSRPPLFRPITLGSQGVAG